MGAFLIKNVLHFFFNGFSFILLPSAEDGLSLFSLSFKLFTDIFLFYKFNFFFPAKSVLHMFFSRSLSFFFSLPSINLLDFLCGVTYVSSISERKFNLRKTKKISLYCMSVHFLFFLTKITCHICQCLVTRIVSHPRWYSPEKILKYQRKIIQRVRL